MLSVLVQYEQKDMYHLYIRLELHNECRVTLSLFPSEAMYNIFL